jgi:hypothetical protein
MSDRAKGQSDALPVTAELGGEGGSWGDGASQQSRERPADGPDTVRDEVVTDIVGNVTRLPEVGNDADAPGVDDDLRKHPTE